MQNNTNSKKLSEKELKERFVQIINALVPVASKLTGQKINSTITKKDFQDFKTVMLILMNLGEKQQKLESQTLPKDFKQIQRMKLADEFLRLFIGKNVQDPASEMLKQMDPGNIKEQWDHTHLSQKIRTQIHRIILSIDSKSGNVAQINKFFESIGEDTFSISQLANRINERTSYIMKDRKRIDEKIIKYYIEAYEETSRFMEVLIAVLYGMKQILANYYKSYHEIRKNPTGNQINELKKDPLFFPFINSYKTNIRNSIIHGRYHVDPILSKIEFTDQKKESMAYHEFIDYVKDITKRGILLSHFEYEMNYLFFLRYIELRNQIMNNS